MAGSLPQMRVSTFDAADLGMVFLSAKILVGKQYKLLWCQQCRWLRWLSVGRTPKEISPTTPARDATWRPVVAGGFEDAGCVEHYHKTKMFSLNWASFFGKNIPDDRLRNNSSLIGESTRPTSFGGVCRPGRRCGVDL